MARVKVTAIHKKDAYYSTRNNIIGTVGIARDLSNTGYGWYSLELHAEDLDAPIQLMFAGIEILDRPANRNPSGESNGD